MTKPRKKPVAPEMAISVQYFEPIGNSKTHNYVIKFGGWLVIECKNVVRNNAKRSLVDALMRFGFKKVHADQAADALDGSLYRRVFLSTHVRMTLLAVEKSNGLKELAA